jgi:small-conductance mechanosensitive channel
MGSFIWIILSIFLGLIYSFFNTLPGLSSTISFDIVWFLFLFCTGVTIARFLSYVLNDILFTKIQGKASSDLLRFIISFVLYTTIMTLMFKYALGWNLTAILTTSALLTAVIGFALQATLGNLFSGVALQIEQAFYIGDVIRIGNRLGRIESLRWRSIVIRTFDATRLVIPNNQISTETVEVYPANKPVRITAIIPAPMQISPEKITRIIVKIILAAPNVDTTMKPLIRIYEYETIRGIINYQIRYFVDNYIKKHIVDGMVKDRIWYAFHRHNIHLPTMPAHPPDLLETGIQTPAPKQPVISRETIAACITAIEHFSDKSQQTIETLAQHVNVYTYATGEPILYTEPKIAARYYIYQGIVKIKHPAANHTDDFNSCPIGKDFYEYWPSDVLKTVHQQLCLFMGPVSEQLVKQASNATLDTRQLYLLLAENISDKDDQREFLELSPDYACKIYMKGSWFHTNDIIMTEAFAQNETTLLEVPDDADETDNN